MNISSWILSITGIIIVTLLTEIVLPNGKTGKIIKSVLAIFSIFVIVSPLKVIDFNNFDFFSIVTTNLEINKDFIENREIEKMLEHEKNIEENLNSSGYKGIKIKIEGEYKNENFNINNVFVDLKNLVLLNQNLNINKYTNIIAIIKNIIKVEEKNIIFYE